MAFIMFLYKTSHLIGFSKCVTIVIDMKPNVNYLSRMFKILNKFSKAVQLKYKSSKFRVQKFLKYLYKPFQSPAICVLRHLSAILGTLMLISIKNFIQNLIMSIST